MRRARSCLAYIGLVSSLAVLASDNDSLGHEIDFSLHSIGGNDFGASGIALRRLEVERFLGLQSSQEGSNSLIPGQRLPPNLFDRLEQAPYDHREASTDDSTQEDHSASEDLWSSFHEGVDEKAVTETDLACSPRKFLFPMGMSGAIGDASELLKAFRLFAQQNISGSKKLLIFMTAGRGEEIISNRQISQRSVMYLNLRKQHAGFFNPSDGVAELSDDGRLQVEALHGIFAKFAQMVKSLPPDQRMQTCVDGFFTSTLQSGIETCLEAFTDHLETLACQSATGGAYAHQQEDGYMCSDVRLMAVPHLREVVETAGDVGESFPVILKKTKSLRIQNGFQRDIFDCAVANYGIRWKERQIGGLGSIPAFFEEEVASAREKAKSDTEAAVAAELLQSLDKFAYPKGANCSRRLESLMVTFSFLRDSAQHEAPFQRAVWSTPEETEPDYVEPDSSVLRRGLSLLRSICAVETASRYILTGHPKLVERLTGQPVNNGELIAFALDCAVLAKRLADAGFRPWESSKK
ncbi:uncharacterized protein LOC34624170 [Cyclospora cayetanensis]|uniref:Uncharacterized protein LOC34624170 n=1 Tax=Cyclospora cayetanensis TaxID=88456 RepID=A0A6P6RWD2_9EIME|nr:uncharacterized protein LOC34624170 [Cyclospora cayetanensis]